MKIKYETGAKLNSELKNPSISNSTDGIRDIITQRHLLSVTGKGPAWTSATKTIVGPEGWKRAIAQVDYVDLRYNGSDHHVTQIGFSCGLSTAPKNRIKILVEGIIRDKNADDSRNIKIGVMILFTV